MLTKQFWLDTLERAVKTFAQAALATLGAGSVDILSTNWVGAVSVGGGAAVVSVLTSLGSERIGNGGTASATKAVEPAAIEHTSHGGTVA